MPEWAALGVASAAKSARDYQCRNGEGDAHLLASQRFRRSRRPAHTRLPGVRSLAVLLCLHLSAAEAFLPALLRPRTRSVGVRSVVVMNKVRGYYTVSESNGKGWDLIQDEVEGAVFLGNRGARRLFTSGFSRQGPTLASPIKPSDRGKQLNHLRDLQEAHKSLKNEIAQLQKPRGARRVLPSDIMLKSLKKKKLAVKDRIVALTGLLEKKERASEAESTRALRPKRLGQGACASVVLGRDVSTGEEVAIKLEPVEKEGESRLLHEFTVFRSLKGVTGFPNARYFGTADIMGTRSDFLVLDRLGPSVDDLWWAETGGARGLPPHMVLALAAQMLELIRQLHDRGYVHRDLKPENFLFGVAGHASKTLHLIDLGISRKVPGSNPSSQRAVTDVTVVEGKGSKRSRGAAGGVNEEFGGDVGVEAPSSVEFAGTCRYASARAHACLEQGPADDLEAMVYVLAFLGRGALPWDVDGIQDFAWYIETVGVSKQRILDRLPQDESLLRRVVEDGEFALVHGLPAEIGEMLLRLLCHARDRSASSDGQTTLAYDSCRSWIANAEEEYRRRVHQQAFDTLPVS